MVMCVFKDRVGRLLGGEHQCRFFRELLQMLLHLASLSSHGPQFPSAHSITHKANCNWSNKEFDCKMRIVGGTTIQQVCTFFFFFFFSSFHLALSASPSLVLLSSLGTVIYFLGLFWRCVVCCLIQEKKDVCLCISKCQGTLGHSPLNWVFPHT